MTSQAWQEILVLVCLLTLPAASQEPAPAPAEGQPQAKPWHWNDPDRKPFQAWHTDVAVQARLSDAARKRVLDAVGEDPPDHVEIAIVPGWAFFHASMETGAKDGSLFLDISVSRAMEKLRFVPRGHEKPETIDKNWRGEAGSVLSDAGGVYVPKHVKQMIWVNPDRNEAQVEAILTHELVHAIQDEAYPFETFFNFEGLTADEKHARQAIEEGYATFVSGYPAPSIASEAVARSQMPDWTARPLHLFYDKGLALVDQMSSRASSRRELLDLLFRSPPTTTLEVLNPEFYTEARDPRKPVPLRAPPEFLEVREAVASAFAEAGQEAAWQSRLGAFALQSILLEFGMHPDEVAARALWHNDSVMNFGDWRHPTATATIWCLATEDFAVGVNWALRDLLGDRGAVFTEMRLPLADRSIVAYASLDGSKVPQVVVAHLGDSVALIVGDDIGCLVKPKAD